ncbi:MAG: riboflavin biosynthesis protein RibF [Planctomycetaceae bacterium]
MTVGNFDGVHVGHAAIVAALRQTADRLDVPAVALTFDPHPASVLRPESAPVPLTTPDRRAELLAGLGIDAVLVQPADERLMSLPAESFYGDVLRGRLRAVAVVEGADFRFGAARRGDVALLRRWCAADGLAFDVVAPVLAGGEPVSSSRIRSLIATGEVEAANRLLTAPLRLRGTVVQGRQRGAGLGFPTANLSSIATLVPAQGVYAARAAVADTDGDRAPHAAAVHIGPNVSFGETAVSVEVHLVGFSGDLYGRRLDVDFLGRLRDTRRFDSIDDLKAQLAADVAAAVAIVDRPPTVTARNA